MLERVLAMTDPPTTRRFSLAPSPHRRPDLIERELSDELVLYDPESDRAYLLNRSAAAIWDLCDGTRSLEEIARELSPGSPPSDALLRDLASTMRYLGDEGLLGAENLIP
jgi:hypothetical protein